MLFVLFLAADVLTLQQAIDRAIAYYPDAKIASLNREEAVARRASATGALFPRLRAEGGVQVWDRPLDVSFVDTSGPQPDLSLLPEDFRAMLERMREPTRVREQVTMSASVTVAQPLTGLYPLVQARRLEAAGVSAGDAGKERAANELAFKVVDAYVQALTAESGDRTARKGIELAAQLLDRAEQLQKVGMVAPADVLRAKVNAATAKEMALAAKTSAELARAALAMYLRVSPESFLLDQTVQDDRPPPTLDAALAAARDHRPELKEVDARLVQADAAVHLARSQMVPQLTALGQYQATYGQKFALPHQIFFGAQLSWDLWEWGNKWYLIDAAKARAEAGRLEREKLEELLLLDVRQAYTRHAIAAESLQAATVARDAAKALFEAEQGRFGVGQVTATDVSLAQTNYLQAENNYAAARFRILSTRAALDKAMGERPLATR